MSFVSWQAAVYHLKYGKSIAVMALLLLSIQGVSAADIPAFPGAEGFGCRTPGGRGGRIIWVDNLTDSGPGSLRAACQAAGPRMVLFRIAGMIELNSVIQIKEPYLTLSGQSAPGDGICLRGYGLSIQTHDVVLRYIRVRPGDIAGKEVDAISIGSVSRNVVVDHCSASWAVDEILSPSGDIADVTVQWCLIAEALNHSVHSKGAHGYGSLVRAVGGISLHHNLWAHNQDRNPRLGDNYGKPPFPTLDVRNNVMYNFGNLSVIGDVLGVNYVGNYIKPGQNTPQAGGRLRPTDAADTRFFMEGNVVEGDLPATADPRRLFSRMESNGRSLVTILKDPLPVPEVATVSAGEALQRILEGVGAVYPRRDPLDQRIIDDFRKGTGSIVDSQKQVGGWPVYTYQEIPADTDQDGIPDIWEKSHGLNPANPVDAQEIRSQDGYSNLEAYLNSLTLSAAKSRRRT